MEGFFYYSDHHQHLKARPVSPETSIRHQSGKSMCSRGIAINSRISMDPC
jgi:hypothetical protein